MRLHAQKLVVLAESRDGGAWSLRSPSPGKYWPNIDAGARVIGGTTIGTLEVLGRSFILIAPQGVAGNATAIEPRAVEFGETLVELAPGGAFEVAEQTTAAASQVSGLVFRAPTSGRFYGRAAPDKPPFVTVGETLAPGATVCLLEVMKTFHRVHFAGEPARVRDVLVKDGDDVNAGDPLLALEAI
jgi:acetyl-CoA carboxylase biotin carboxyl carrier protein